MITNKKILVTGGAGFIGSNLIKELSKRNEVVSLDNYSTGFHANEYTGVEYIQGDVRFMDMLSLDTDFDMVIHLAALSRIQPSFKDPEETIDVNTIGTMKVLEWAKANDIPKVLYSGSSSRWHNPLISPYATSKKMGEDFCKLYKEVYKMDVEIARFYNVYGPSEIIEGEWAAVIGKWRGQVYRKEPVTIVGDGTQKRAFTHVDDIVDGIVKILESGESHEDAWELGVGTNHSINEVAAMFKQRFPDIEFINIPSQPGEYEETIRENDDALTHLGWKPTKQLSEYVNNLKGEL